MSDFDPTSLFYILYESMGVWLWFLLGLAAVLLFGMIVSARRLMRVGGSLKRPLFAALAVSVVVALLLSFAVPLWTLASPAALSSGIDYLFAFLFALVPGVIVGAVAFMFASRMCSARHAGAA
ncbi:MAG: hypothetical protein KF697_11655 [Pseudolabrys sp.]|nr:hypothetical protein [Pseudolabrys sp.]